MKRILLTALMAMTLLFAAAPTALAGSHHGHHRTSSLRTCTYSSCTRRYTHKHNGRTYRGHYYGDGHRRCRHR